MVSGGTVGVAWRFEVEESEVDADERETVLPIESNVIPLLLTSSVAFTFSCSVAFVCPILDVVSARNFVAKIGWPVAINPALYSCMNFVSFSTSTGNCTSDSDNSNARRYGRIRYRCSGCGDAAG